MGPRRRASGAGSEARVSARTPLVQQSLSQSAGWAQEITFVDTVEKDLAANIPILCPISPFTSLLAIRKAEPHIDLAIWGLLETSLFAFIPFEKEQLVSFFFPYLPVGKPLQPVPRANLFTLQLNLGVWSGEVGGHRAKEKQVGAWLILRPSFVCSLFVSSFASPPFLLTSVEFIFWKSEGPWPQSNAGIFPKGGGGDLQGEWLLILREAGPYTGVSPPRGHVNYVRASSRCPRALQPCYML